MSQENVEIVWHLNTLLDRGDREEWVAYYEPDFEWRDLRHAPDAVETVRGVSAVQAIWDQWAQAFDDFRAEIEECVDAGDYVVAATRWRAKGKGSGLLLDLATTDVFEFANAKVVRVTIGYADRHVALKAVGLEE